MLMDGFNGLLGRRRSCRRFAGGEIGADDVRLILEAALLSPTSRSRRAWHFTVVDDALLLAQLADAKDTGAQFLKGAAVAVVVAADATADDCWIEDCSIAAWSMQLQAEALGLGSCWAQIRGRGLSDGTAAADVVGGVLGLPPELGVLCVVGFGRKAGGDDDGGAPHGADGLKWENVHINGF